MRDYPVRLSFLTDACSPPLLLCSVSDPLVQFAIIFAALAHDMDHEGVPNAQLEKEKPEMGEVIAVGPGRQSEFGQFIRVNAKVGDKVLIPKIGSLRIDFEGDEYYIVQYK